MTSLLSDHRPMRIVLKHVAIHSASGIDARRLADGLMPALERALSAEPPTRVTELQRSRHDRSGSEFAAKGIASAIESRLREATA